MIDGVLKDKDAHLWARHPDDWYVEPRWCDDALFREVRFDEMIVDPCCGLGRILDAAASAGYSRAGFDIVDRGAWRRHAFSVADFFEWTGGFRGDIVCNPPYKYDLEFVRRAVELTQNKCYVLLRSAWANGDKTSRVLQRLPLYEVLQLSPRPSMPPGAVLAAAARKEIDPRTHKPYCIGSGREDYAWYGFVKGYAGAPRFGWLRRPPRRLAAHETPEPKIPW